MAVATVLVALLAGITATLAGPGARAELDSVDARFALRGERPHANVVLVGIDDKTFSELGEQWPFDRRRHAQAIDRLSRARAAAIAYDVQFTERAGDTQDAALLAAVEAAGRRRVPVVLATTEVGPGGTSNVLGGRDVLAPLGARAANAVVPADEDGVIRHLQARVDGMTSFAVAAAWAGQESARPNRATDAALTGRWIDFAGPPGTVTTVSFADLIAGRVPADRLRGKTVVVGATAPSLQDVHLTAASGGLPMAGAEVQANAVASARAGRPLRSAPTLIHGALLALAACLAPMVGLSSFRRLLGATLAGVLGVAACAMLAFAAGVVTPVVGPLTALVAGAIGAATIRYVGEVRERRRVRALFARFVPPAVVDELLADDATGIRLGGRVQDSTVMFCDLRGFTSFSEGAEPNVVIDVLNRYLTTMSDTILEHGGTVVTYLGDGIMAVFGSPVVTSDHAEAALSAAREMLHTRLPELNHTLRSQGLCSGFEMGIGINSGPVTSGNVGSERRVEYAAVGDTTNTAARLEGLTSSLGVPLAVSDTTAMRLPADARALLEEVGSVELRGRSAPVTVWSTAGSGAAIPQPDAGDSERTPELAQLPGRTRVCRL
ncbi:MAG: CHASE2 domain-containing protein [Solirubrobacterales bacterium]